jgi:hypothetical protein
VAQARAVALAAASAARQEESAASAVCAAPFAVVCSPTSLPSCMGAGQGRGGVSAVKLSSHPGRLWLERLAAAVAATAVASM